MKFPLSKYSAKCRDYPVTKNSTKLSAGNYPSVYWSGTLKSVSSVDLVKTNEPDTIAVNTII